MVTSDLEGLGAHFRGSTLQVAAVNGNRFFADSNRRLNYLVRYRKSQTHFSYGGSLQLGTQLVPAGLNQTNRDNVYGVDAQWTLGRLGIRGEFAHGNRPSTLPTLETLFTPGFIEGQRVRTIGSSVSALWALTPRAQAYVRVDRLVGDTFELCPEVKDQNCIINGVNGGLRWNLSQIGTIGVDVQWKSRVSHDDDAVNTRLQITSGITF
jgi:hypothetical protein